MTTQSKDFRVKNGLTVADGGTFGGTVQAATPVNEEDLTTKAYVDSKTLSSLYDTLISTPTNNDILLYDGNNWVNAQNLAKDTMPDIMMMMGA